MRPQVGEIISGKYRLVRLIGEGGMGSVYEARHEYLGTAVALKFLDPDLARRTGLVARFLQEARVSASVRSPHVVHVSDVDQTSAGLPYLVMELLEGETLQRMLTRSGRLPLNVALDVAVQVLNGLEAAHSARIVHRDLKPDNVFVVQTRQGSLVKLLDFGIAKLRVSEEFQKGLTRPGVLMGTPEYMAPEQAFSADTADQRADLYSLGVIVFEMITGRRPVAGDDPRIMAAGVLAGKYPSMIDVDPTVPPALSAIVHRAMSGRAMDRYSSAAELRDALLPFFKATPNSNLASQVQTPAPEWQQPAPVGPGPAPTAPGSDPGGGVAPTQPPDEPQPEQGRTGTVVGGAPAMGAYGPATNLGGPYGYAPPAPVPAPVAVYAGTAPPATRLNAKKGVSIGLIAAVAGALAAAAAIAIVVGLKQRDDGPEIAPSQALPPPTVISVPTATETTAPPPTTATPTATYTKPQGTNTPSTKRDAGADAGAEGADAAMPFPFPMPSQLPSSFPIPIPSSFPIPPIPGFPQ